MLLCLPSEKGSTQKERICSHGANPFHLERPCFRRGLVCKSKHEVKKLSPLSEVVKNCQVPFNGIFVIFFQSSAINDSLCGGPYFTVVNGQL